jgi:hypothetical protein
MVDSHHLPRGSSRGLLRLRSAAKDGKNIMAQIGGRLNTPR